VVSFPQVSPPKPCTHISPSPYALHAPPISFFLILSPAQYWVRSTDYSVPHYVIPCVHYTAELLAGTEKWIWDNGDQIWRENVTSNPARWLRVILKWVLNKQWWVFSTESTNQMQ
jgi:hypothetical protein